MWGTYELLVDCVGAGGGCGAKEDAYKGVWPGKWMGNCCPGMDEAAWWVFM